MCLKPSPIHRRTARRPKKSLTGCDDVDEKASLAVGLTRSYQHSFSFRCLRQQIQTADWQCWLSLPSFQRVSVIFTTYVCLSRYIVLSWTLTWLTFVHIPPFSLLAVPSHAAKFKCQWCASHTPRYPFTVLSPGHVNIKGWAHFLWK